MEAFRHVSPHEERHLEEHQFELEIEGEIIGTANARYYRKPFPHYFFPNISIDDEFQGKRYGRKLVSAIEAVLEQKGKSGVLIDNIFETSPAAGMYTRSGWQTIQDSGLLVYNPPSNLSEIDLHKLTNKYS